MSCKWGKKNPFSSVCIYSSDAKLCACFQGGREHMSLPLFKDRVIRGRRKCGWSAMVFGSVALLESHRVPSAVHWGHGIPNGHGTTERRCKAQPGHQDSHSTHKGGRNPRGASWQSLGQWRGKKRGLQAGVDGRGGIGLRAGVSSALATW